MDLQEIWKDLQPKTDEVLDVTHIEQIKPLRQKNPLKRAKKMLGKNIVLSVLISLIYILIIIIFRYWQIQLFIGITLIFTLWTGYNAYRFYQTIKVTVSAANLLSELKRVHATLKEWIRVQMKVALFIYPFSATGGYFVGGVLGSGKSVEEFMNKSFVVYALIAIIIILTPASYYLSKWVFKKFCGKIMGQLESLINELTEGENASST